MTSPKATICVSTRNRAASYLEKCLKSILSQTLKDFVLILSDNGSTDSTPEVVRRIGDPRIRYVRHEDDLGMTANWNRAIEPALREPAPYAALYHDDDFYAPEILEKEASFLDRHPEAGLVHTAMHYFNEEEGTYVPRKPYPVDRVLSGIELLDDLCLRGLYQISTPTVLARKEAYAQAGLFDTRFTICPDLDLWWRMLDRWKLGYIAEPLYVQTIHRGQASSSVRAVEVGVTQDEPMEAVLRALRRIRAAHPKLDANLYERRVRRFFASRMLGTARTALLSRDPDSANRACAEAVRLSPELGIRAEAMLLQAANNPLGRLTAAAAVRLHNRLLRKKRP